MKMIKLRLFVFSFILLALAAVSTYLYLQNQARPAIETKFVPNTTSLNSNSNPEVEIRLPNESALLPNPKHVFQTFNNCGPATLSMVLGFWGTDVSQKELADKMRPWQIASGDNDDKTIFSHEFVDWAQEYGYEAISRVNGDIEVLKKLVSNNIPVVVKTWLNPDEDIGHFRLVRGFDQSKQVIIQDDSYHGKDKQISYYDFLNMWQPFNYNYIVVYKPENQAKIKAILGEEIDPQTAWQNALSRAKQEHELDPQNPYPVFNIATASYQLGNYKQSVDAFEKVQGKLPRRMLWYQIEPIWAYYELKNYDRVFAITDQILENGNRAFSELYLIRGKIYEQEGNLEAARQQYELALKYNENYKEAKEALKNLISK